MKNLVVRRYDISDFAVWNDFVDCSKNGTFLFHRTFMEHHQERFEDFSLVVLDGQKWVAILPANREGAIVFSHKYLTYGGLVYGDSAKLVSIVSIFGAVLSFLNELKISKLHLKMIPAIYNKKPADEMLYALFLVNATLTHRDTLSVIDLRQKYKISKTRLEAVRRGAKMGLEIREEQDLALFWNEILIPNMDNRHGTLPIHNLEQISYLRDNFQENIRHFNVYYKNKIVAGTTIFVAGNVVHPQHISALENRSELGSLDFLYHYLLTSVFKEYTFFDFGISNENYGRKLKESLIYWKESYGASSIVQDFYEVETANFVNCNNYLI